MNQYPSQKLVTIKRWIEQKFMKGSAPSANSVRRWCREGLISSEQVGRKWYIHAGAEYHGSTTSTDEDLEQMINRISRKF